MVPLVGSDAPEFLAILEFNEEVDTSKLKAAISGSSAVAHFKLLKAFGEPLTYFAS
jgi:hypothetical protein